MRLSAYQTFQIKHLIRPTTCAITISKGMAFITQLANTKVFYTGYFAHATPLEFASNQWFALKTVAHISSLPRSVGRCNFLAKISSLEDNFTVFEKDLLQKSQTCNFFVTASFLFRSCCRLDQSSVQQRSSNSEKKWNLFEKKLLPTFLFRWNFCCFKWNKKLIQVLLYKS